MSKKVNNPGCKIYVKHFAGANTTCIKYYMQPSLKNAPNHFILYVDANDLTPTKQPKILRILATSLKNDQHDKAYQIAYLEQAIQI